MNQAELKRARALQNKKFRSEERRFLVQGRKVVEELLRSSWQAEVIFASAEAAEFVEPLARAARGGAVPVRTLPDHELEKIGTLEKGNELIALAVMPDQAKARAPRPNEIILALAGIADPRNMGGLMRIADWFGIQQVLCSQDSMEVWNPKCVQSTMGSLFRVHVRYVRLFEELSTLAAGGANLYVADMGGDTVYDVPLAAPAVLVMGSESHGISAAVRALEQARVIAIPRVGGAESLNVAMATAGLLTEFTRQLKPR